MSDAERRFAEFRYDAERGVIEGVAIRYGDRAHFGEGFTEEFRAGAFGQLGDVISNLQHDRARPVARTGAGLSLSDGADALRVAITLPDTSYAREARELVAARILRGFSVEFRASRDFFEERHRVIESAELLGVALVDRPAYPDSVIAERWRASLTVQRPTWRYWY